MSRIIVIEFVSLDGVIHDPDGADGSTHGGWAFRHGPQAVAGDKFRLGALLDTGALLLIFNEGYRDRGDLADEAIRLGRMLTALMPDESEADGLLALMLCHDSRREARFAGDELVALADQDRSLWEAGAAARRGHRSRDLG